MKKKLLKVMNEILEVLEFILASVILVVLVIMIGVEVRKLFLDPAMFQDPDFLNLFLGNITTVIVALEFVKMLLRPTVGNTLEMLIMAIARYVVLHHHDYIAIAVGIGSIVALFAARRFLLAKMPVEDEKKDAELMNADL